MGERRPSLTARQREILAWIEAASRREGMPPTVREIGEAFGMRSTGTVRGHLEALRRKGYLGRVKSRRHRGIRVSQGAGRPAPILRLESRPPESPVREVPILGRVAAGPTLLAEQNLEGTVALGADLLPRSGEVFALRIRGESMIDAGILDGDLALVRRQERAEPGEIVVAMVEGETTVKFFRPERGPLGPRIRLEPANAAMRPIVLDPSSGSVSILGKVVGVVRTY